jgi:PPOX class probable F420-dependent enzyme
MGRMTVDECKAFIRAKARPAVAAVVRADGRPHATPVWIDLDGDQIVFTTWHESLKARALLRDPRVALCIDDDAPPFAFVVIEGTATLSGDSADLRYWAGRIGGRYMGADQADAYSARNGVPGELLVRVTITKIVGMTDVAA